MKILAQMSQHSQKEMASEPTNQLEDDAHVHGLLASPTELKMENMVLMFESC